MKVYGYIYLIQNIQNNKIYIGKTISKDPIEYIEKHFVCAANNADKNKKYFYNSIRKYGKQNFKWRILGECYSKKELNKSEIESIYLYRSFGSDGKNQDSIYGYNCTIGGDGGKISEIPWNKGLTKETNEILKKQGEILSTNSKGKLKPTRFNNLIKHVNIKEFKEDFLNPYISRTQIIHKYKITNSVLCSLRIKLFNREILKQIESQRKSINASISNRNRNRTK